MNATRRGGPSGPPRAGLNGSPATRAGPYIGILLLAANAVAAPAWFIEGMKQVDGWDLPAAEEQLGGQAGTPHALWLKGLIALHRGRYDEARGLIAAAGQPDGVSNEAYDYWVSVASSTAEGARGLLELRSPHFIIRYTEPDALIIDAAREALEKARTAVGQDLGFVPDEPVLVEIYPTPERFTQASTLTSRDMEVAGAIGLCKFNRLMIASPRVSLFGYRYLDALCHEYTHYVVQRITQGSCFLWLHEGLAKTEERRWRLPAESASELSMGQKELLAKAVREGTLVPFAKMHPSLIRLKDRDEVGTAFAQVAHALVFLRHKKGPSFLPELLKTMAEEEHPEFGFARAYGRPVESFEEEWLQELRREDMETTLGGAGIERIALTGADDVSTWVDREAQMSLRLGDRFRRAGRLEVALSEYEKARALSPRNPVILNRLGRTLLALGRPGEAEATWWEGIRNNSNYADNFKQLGLHLLADGNSRDAATLLAETLEMIPFDPVVRDAARRAGTPNVLAP